MSVCTCASCRVVGNAEENMARAHAASVPGHCVNCYAPVADSVTRILAVRGNLRCEDCHKKFRTSRTQK